MCHIKEVGVYLITGEVADYDLGPWHTLFNLLHNFNFSAPTRLSQIRNFDTGGTLPEQKMVTSPQSDPSGGHYLAGK